MTNQFEPEPKSRCSPWLCWEYLLPDAPTSALGSASTVKQYRQDAPELGPRSLAEEGKEGQIFKKSDQIKPRNKLD